MALVKCRHCGQESEADAKFCPKCGAAKAAAKSRTWLWALLALPFSCLIISGLTGQAKKERVSESSPKVGRVPGVDLEFAGVWAANLLQEFRDNPIAADKKHGGKSRDVIGILDRIERDGDGAKVYLRTSVHIDPKQRRSHLLRLMDQGERSINAEIQGADADALAEVRPGQLVALRGVVKKGSGDDGFRLGEAKLSWSMPPLEADPAKADLVAATQADLALQCMGKLGSIGKFDDQRMFLTSIEAGKEANQRLAAVPSAQPLPCPGAMNMVLFTCADSETDKEACGLPEVSLASHKTAEKWSMADAAVKKSWAALEKKK